MPSISMVNEQTRVEDVKSDIAATQEGVKESDIEQKLAELLENDGDLSLPKVHEFVREELTLEKKIKHEDLALAHLKLENRLLKKLFAGFVILSFVLGATLVGCIWVVIAANKEIAIDRGVAVDMAGDPLGINVNKLQFPLGAIPFMPEDVWGGTDKVFVQAPWNRNIKLAMNVHEIRVNAIEHTASLTTQSKHTIFIGRQCSLLQMVNESGGSTFYPFVSACETCTAFSVVASDTNNEAVYSFHAAEKAARESNIVGHASWPQPLLNVCTVLLELLHKGARTRILQAFEGNTSADRDNTTTTTVRVPTIVSTPEGNGTTVEVTPAEDNTTGGNTTTTVSPLEEDNTTNDNNTEGNATEGNSTTEDSTTGGNTTTTVSPLEEDNTTNDNNTEGNATEGNTTNDISELTQEEVSELPQEQLCALLDEYFAERPTAGHYTVVEEIDVMTKYFLGYIAGSDMIAIPAERNGVPPSQVKIDVG